MKVTPSLHMKFIAALLVIAKKWEQPECLPADEWINECDRSMQWNVIHPWKGMKY